MFARQSLLPFSLLFDRRAVRAQAFAKIKAPSAAQILWVNRRQLERGAQRTDTITVPLA